MKRLAALAAVLALAACGGTTSVIAPPTPSPGNSETVRAVGSQHCGIERWPVKTGSDADAAMVDLTHAAPATIAQLTTIPAPAVLPQDNRIRPVETTVYQVTATLREFKLETDSDYHLVLTDGTSTMIAEIPDPACVAAGSPFLPGITAARAQFDARYHPGPSFQQAGVQVVVTGIGYFDTIHGQTGVAPNGVEIHPVLDIQFK